MSIYSLMICVPSLKKRVLLAYHSWKTGQDFYDDFEQEAFAILDALLDVDYISEKEFSDFWYDLFHIFLLYRHHCKREEK